MSNFSPAQMEIFHQAAPLHATTQPPYNLFEQAIESDVLPYAKRTDLAVLAYGALCRGLLSGKIPAQTQFDGDDLRRIDPKCQPPRFARYLAAVAEFECFARERFDKSGLALAVRWILDQGPRIAVRAVPNMSLRSAKCSERLEDLWTGDSRPLPVHLKAQIVRELDRLGLLLEQLKTVAAERDGLVKPAGDGAPPRRRPCWCG